MQIQSSWKIPPEMDYSKHLGCRYATSSLYDTIPFINAVIFALQTKGRDEIEDYVINTLEVTSLPVLCIFTAATSVGEASPMDIEQKVWSIWYPYTDLSQFNFNLSAGPTAIETILGYNSHLDSCSRYPLTLFVAGDRSSVGKSSVCLAMIASLIRLGL